MKYIDFSSVLKNSGFASSRFHKSPNAVKTDAPISLIFDIFRSQLVEDRKRSEPAQRAGAKKISHELNFEIVPEIREKKKNEKFFLPNPADDWGPKKKAKF